MVGDKPLQGAIVTFYISRLPIWALYSIVFVDTNLTNSNGIAEFSLRNFEPGNYTWKVRVLKEGFLPVESEDYFFEVRDKLTLLLEAPPTGYNSNQGPQLLKVRVVNKENHAVPGALVTFSVRLPYPPYFEQKKVLTNSHGETSAIIWLSENGIYEWTAVAEKPGFDKSNETCWFVLIVSETKIDPFILVVLAFFLGLGINYIIKNLKIKKSSIIKELIRKETYIKSQSYRKSCIIAGFSLGSAISGWVAVTIFSIFKIEIIRFLELWSYFMLPMLLSSIFGALLGYIERKSPGLGWGLGLTLSLLPIFINWYQQSWISFSENIEKIVRYLRSTQTYVDISLVSSSLDSRLNYSKTLFVIITALFSFVISYIVTRLYELNCRSAFSHKEMT